MDYEIIPDIVPDQCVADLLARREAILQQVEENMQKSRYSWDRSEDICNRLGVEGMAREILEGLTLVRNMSSPEVAEYIAILIDYAGQIQTRQLSDLEWEKTLQD